MKNLSNWRSVRLAESRLQHELRQRHSFRLHGICIGLATLGLTWGASHLQMLLGVDSLALRYLLSLGLGYLGYLLMLRLWAGAMVSRSEHSQADWLDAGDLIQSWPSGGPRCGSAPPADLKSGGGGDFAGGGASGDFSGPADAAWVAKADGAGALGEMAGGAIDAAASADEGAIVVVPVAVIFLLGCAVFLGAGTLLLYFGWEALLAVAVELAFSYVTARSAVRVVREGWLAAVLRLTWKPLLGTVVCAFILGAGIDFWMPAADSLPQAIRLLRAAGS